ncbi:type I restriction endonuclease subunit R [Marinilabilia salmonicolor]|uniref:Type I restriction enzyme endonuclease subunit n=1 Tax=Marinilabilia salmonicolor TaxID=989 RepID=A0A368UYB5_9BACT|nr:HsdR family type I site-specific deoxyribonuclease [Marinilabilia salmonicolor]RCW33868.1 type I restriction enzyme R subunit [Marinilabilia salmonicolor]
MSKIGHLERETQDRIVKLFRDTLGYRYLGNWGKEMRYSNIEETLLEDFLRYQKKYSDDLIAKAMDKLRKVAGDQSKSLYDVNKEVYSLLRYGVNVSPGIGQNKVNVELFDWENPKYNDFAIAEEVSVHGTHKKRPDIVIYINGIAVGVLELKRSTVSISEGIRQNLDNQKKEFIQPFFSTMQFIMAGNDHEGLAYGTIDTTEKYYLRWKEVSEEANPNDKYLLEITAPIRRLADSFDYRLDKNIIQMLHKERFIELLHDFIVFDRGVKKLCRPNQYFGVKAAQDHSRRREGGIIWHTQGSGKSLTMVWLTKWIRENISNARVLIITDRTELDEQIEKVYRGVNEDIYRTKSGSDLIQQLDNNSPWLICSLVHKFGGKEDLNDKEVDNYLQELKRGLPSDFRAKGEFFVFVDECHRTQSGKLHDGMKMLLPNAVFIGFTGTPLLKKDKQTSLEVFGEYIHTYKFDEAVSDKVVLDLQYEARDIEQKITSMDKIDQWFDAKTRGLTDMARAELKQKWGTMKKVFSSRSRLDKIVADVMLDMGTKERLENGQGNAMLVSESVYNACRYYQLFQDAGLKKCAIVTSYAPSADDIKGETTGEGDTEKLLKYEVYRKMLDGKDPETFETEVKKKFVEEPGQMKLLIVVDKLLTGFDAPPATYLYIDKSMRDHGLFQAICRVNRLDGDDKDYGYIVDYKDLFKTLNKSIKDYTSGAFDAYAKEDVEGLLKDRLDKSRERLEDAQEAARALIEPVEPPKEQLQFQRHFVGDPENKDDLKDTEPRRQALYKAVTKLNRAFANIADELMDAGYSEKEIYDLREEVKFFENVRKEIQLFSGDYIDLKQYEPAMRHLIDSYIGAEESKILASFEELGLVDLLVAKGVDGIDEMPEKLKKNPESMSEAIESNLRKVIIEERPTNPAYFDKMSVLLDEIIKLRKLKAQEYKEYLKKIVELARQVKRSGQVASSPYPSSVNTEGKQALYDNLEKDEKLAIAVDEKIRYNKKDDWRDNKFKQKKVLNAIKEALKENGHSDQEKAQAIFDLIKNRTDY